MKKHRRTVESAAVERTALKVVATRLAAVVATTGILVVGAVAAPAQADTGWNRKVASTTTVHR